MSERAIAQLTEAIQQLTLSVDELAREIRNRPLASPAVAPPTAAASVAQVGYSGTVHEPSRLPFPEHYTQEEIKHTYRTIEEGPPAVPAFVFKSLQDRLTEKEPGSRTRASSAYKAGFWARAALGTHTKYVTREAIRGLKACHWVVLRSDHPVAFRTTSRSDVDILCRSSDPEVVCESFASLAELEAFCLGAGVPVPVLKSAWKDVEVPTEVSWGGWR